MQFDQRFHQRQSKPRSTVGRDVVMVSTLRERLEYPGKIAFSDSDAGIFHGNHAFPSFVEGDG